MIRIDDVFANFDATQSDRQNKEVLLKPGMNVCVFFISKCCFDRHGTKLITEANSITTGHKKTQNQKE